MMLTAAVAASCQTAEPGGVDRSADVAGPQDAGPRPASTSLVFRQVFPAGPGGLTPAYTEIDFGTVDFPAVRALSVGPGDDLWIAGRLSAPLALGATMLTSAGPSDVFVSRLDPTGRPRWARTLGGPHDDACGGMALDAGGDAMVAYQDPAAGPVTLAKLGPDGTLLWQKPLATRAGAAAWGAVRSAAADGVGGMLLVTSDIDGQFVARVDANGDVLWRTRVPLADKDPIALAVDGAGNAIIGGASTTGGSDRLLKVTASGDLRLRAWIHGHDGNSAFRNIGADRLGNILLSGNGGASFGDRPTPPEHRRDPWIAKLDGGGTALWEVFGVAGRVAADDAGNVLCANAGSVGKLDPQGSWIWQHAARIDGEVGAVAADSAGRVIYAGRFQGRADFGDGPVDSGEHAALFVAALAP
jgi:outer membrane protein assembly factor BamB